MSQALHNQSDLTQEAPSPPSSHPKIRPIVSLSSQRKELLRYGDPKQLKKVMKSRSKNSIAYRLTQGTLGRPKIQLAREASEILKAQNSLREFYYLLYSSWAFQNAFFAAKLRTWPTVSSLSLNTIEEPQCSYVRRLLKSITSLKNFKEMKFNLACPSPKRSDLAQTLLKSLKSSRTLTSLDFDMYMGMHPEPQQIDAISYLSKLTQLQHLKVSVSPYMESNDKNLLTLLSSVLPKLTKLTQLELGLKSRQIQAPHLLRLFKSFRDTQNLSDITLILNYRGIIGESTIDILAEGLSYLHASLIQKLSFSLFLNKRLQSLSRLAQALERFTSLKTLSLKFAFTHVLQDQPENFSLTELNSAIRGLESLSSLSLDLISISSEEFLIEGIATVLRSLKNLNRLKLIFPRATKTTEEHIQQLFSSLKNLTSLQFLNIAVEKQQECVTDAALETLAESLKELTSIKKLALNFEMNGQIANKGVISICEAVKGLSNLSSLTLNFTKNPNIDERTVHQILQTLRLLPCLYNVIICLYKCPKLIPKRDDLQKSFDDVKKAGSFVEGQLEIPFCRLMKYQFMESDEEENH